MFKRYKKSVIKKNNLFITNLVKKRVNKTPNKRVFPYRTNLTLANIIVNKISTQDIRSIDFWNIIFFSCITNCYIKLLNIICILIINLFFIYKIIQILSLSYIIIHFQIEILKLI